MQLLKKQANLFKGELNYSRVVAMVAARALKEKYEVFSKRMYPRLKGIK